MTQKTARGLRSKNPSHLYRQIQRIPELSPKLKIQADKVAEDLLQSVQLLSEDRISENRTLKYLMSEEDSEVFVLVKQRILLTLKKLVKAMHSF